MVSDKTGNYYLNPNIHLVTDAGLFESFYRHGMLPSSSRKEKIHYLRQATQLYEHELLPNYTDWLDNQRAHYHLSYLKAIMELLPLLYQEEAYSEMYSVSSAALNLEPGNGDIQFWHMRAMISLGGIEIAQKHYSQHNQCDCSQNTPAFFTFSQNNLLLSGKKNKKKPPTKHQINSHQ